MNVENILKVADAIEQHSIPDLGFSMRAVDSPTDHFRDYSGRNCGTVACILGWTRRLLPESYNNWLEGGDHPFEISPHKWGMLTMPEGWRQSTATDKEAVAVLRHLAATGEVDWSIADKAA